MSMSSSALSSTPAQRLAVIAQARRQVLEQRCNDSAQGVEDWITRSWQRCLARGQRFEQRLGFEVVTKPQTRRILDANRQLVQAAKPALASMAQAMVHTGYFAILVNSQGTVIDADGPIDAHDRRATLITRIGVDLSEQAVGTSAISAALHEQQPIWLHRGEHFHHDTSIYSCAGAPLFGPQGDCVGMLDLTGIEARERPELKHLVAASAQQIENNLVQALNAHALLRMQWPGHALGGDADGLLALGEDGQITGMNRTARQMLGLWPEQPASGKACASEVFAIPLGLLFDTLRRGQVMQAPLWSGLRVQLCGVSHAPTQHNTSALPLKDIEASLIKDTVAQHRGNVAAAAKALGISRATVYRKLAARTPRDPTRLH